MASWFMFPRFCRALLHPNGRPFFLGPCPASQAVFMMGSVPGASLDVGKMRYIPLDCVFYFMCILLDASEVWSLLGLLGR
jgi:hypothetical protein